MSATETRHESVWVATGPEQPALPRLEGDVTADVAVIGGGIVGITMALLLKEAGANVVLLEAHRLARGVTGYTTAKVSSQHGMMYAQLRSKFGSDAARLYGEANEEALAWIARRVESDGIDCDFRRQPSFAYVTSASKKSDVEEEAEAAIEAGLPASYTETSPLPYPIEAAVRFEDQAEFHVRKYLLALAQGLSGRAYDQSPALGVSGDVVRTPAGSVRAEHIVVATHYPFLDRSLAFARVHPQRSYAILCRIAGRPPDGMHISGDSPTRSIRAVPVMGEELLLVGGEGHKPGTGGDTEERYAKLEAFAREHWDVASVDYRWSAQDNTTVDTLPYIGRLSPVHKKLYMATGFAKWGMTGGTAAAMILTDLVLGRENRFAELFDPNRFKPLAAATKFAKENAEAGVHFVGDRLRHPGTRSSDDLQPGEAGIVRMDGKKVAAYRDESGKLLAVSPTCTHLGCLVNWNTAEKSWDCPCHGSRFAPDGEVLQGPAVKPLERKSPP